MPKERLSPDRTKDRKGPETVYATLQDLIKLQLEAGGFSFLPKYAVQSILSGRHRSKLRGRGLDFDEVRQYIMGDDIRNIDWKVTARTGVTHTKEFTEERERPVFFVVDQTQSMFFGSQEYFKSVIAAHLAALGCWRTLDVGDRVGGLVFNDEREAFVKPQRNRKTVQQFLSNVSIFNHELELPDGPKEASGSLEKALSRTHQLVSHDYLVVVLTDLYKIDENCLKKIIQIRRSNDVIVGTISDPVEEELGFDEAILSDGYNRLRLSDKSQLKETYASDMNALKQELSAEFKKYGIPYLKLNTLDKASNQLRDQLSNSQAVR